jgi:hypothetical protein
MIQTFSMRRVVSVVDRTWENIYPTFSSSLGSTLLLIEKATHDPLYLWDISHSLQLLLLSFIYSYFIYLHYQISLKTCLLVFTANPWSKLLVNTFCFSLGSTLLFIESTTIHPVYLWVITRGCEDLLPYLPGNGARKELDIYTHFYPCRQCWASKCRGL